VYIAGALSGIGLAIGIALTLLASVALYRLSPYRRPIR
jgi:multisubunit Na+/H+ antiporter MnhG subunit